MPRYISIPALAPRLRAQIRNVLEVPEPNPLLRNPTPTDYLLAAQDAGHLPDNVRVQTWINDKERWAGLSRLERYGGRKTKDWGKAWRIGRGREARKWGGLVHALRER